MIIGSHVSFNKEEQLLKSVKEALSYNATTFMFYTGAPQNTKRVPIDAELTEQAKKLMIDNNIDINNVVVHAPYIINMANKLNFSFNVNFLKEEINRVSQLGIKRLVIHPGSHVGAGIVTGLNNIIDVLNEVITKEQDVMICLETMAGKGSELGTNFVELKTIIDGVNIKDKVFVCLDACHINDAGYDLTDFNKILDEFDKIIGLEYLKVIHVNDSKNILGSKKDRHENIGLGTIGFDNLNNIIKNEKIKDIPKILETPFIDVDDKKYPPYLFEIKMFKENRFNENLINDIVSYYK